MFSAIVCFPVNILTGQWTVSDQVERQGLLKASCDLLQPITCLLMPERNCGDHG